MLFCSGCAEGLLANAVTIGHVVKFGSFRDCAGKSRMLLGCLQAFHLRRVDAVEEEIDVIELGKNN